MMMDETLQQLGHSVDSAARVSGICREKIYQALRTGALKGKKAGRRTIIPDDSLREFIANLPDATFGTAILK